MSRRLHVFRHPDRCVIGTVGLPGERTFFLQVRQGADLVSVVLEKQQALALADRMEEVVEESSSSVSMEFVAQDADIDPLDAPIIEEFRAAALALGWDEQAHAVVIEAHADGEIPEIGSDDEDAPDTLRVWLSVPMAQLFIARTRRVVAAGRPPCPFCSQPLDPGGHLCPRANGYRRRG